MNIYTQPHTYSNVTFTEVTELIKKGESLGILIFQNNKTGEEATIYNTSDGLYLHKVVRSNGLALSSEWEYLKFGTVNYHSRFTGDYVTKNHNPRYVRVSNDSLEVFKIGSTYTDDSKFILFGRHNSFLCLLPDIRLLCIPLFLLPNGLSCTLIQTTAMPIIAAIPVNTFAEYLSMPYKMTMLGQSISSVPMKTIAQKTDIHISDTYKALNLFNSEDTIVGKGEVYQDCYNNIINMNFPILGTTNIIDFSQCETVKEDIQYLSIEKEGLERVSPDGSLILCNLPLPNSHSLIKYLNYYFLHPCVYHFNPRIEGEIDSDTFSFEFCQAVIFTKDWFLSNIEVVTKLLDVQLYELYDSDIPVTVYITELNSSDNIEEVLTANAIVIEPDSNDVALDFSYSYGIGRRNGLIEKPLMCIEFETLSTNSNEYLTSSKLLEWYNDCYKSLEV